MLTVSRNVQKGIFERIVRAKNGALMRVRFQVYEIEGELKGKVLGIEPVISIEGDSTDDKAYLCGTCSSICGAIEYISPFKSVISPYNELYFFTSQPTRAPSFK